MSALDQDQRVEYLVLDAGLSINTEDPTNEHWGIFEAVQAHDDTAARAPMQEHVERSAARIIPKFEATTLATTWNCSPLP